MQRLPENAGVNKLKRKRRDLERVLRKPGLSAEKKQEVERALNLIASDLETALGRNQTKKIAQKYHMVKFFERKKALRALKKQNAGTQELVDYHYVTTFPVEQKYIALFAPGSEARSSDLYKKVLKNVSDGKLPGKEEVLTSANVAAKENQAKAQTQTKHKKQDKQSESSSETASLKRKSQSVESDLSAKSQKVSQKSQKSSKPEPELSESPEPSESESDSESSQSLDSNSGSDSEDNSD